MQGSKYKAGDKITMKKPHACGANDWEIQRTGVDVKLLCRGCGRSLWMKRRDFDKKIRKIQCADGNYVSLVNYRPEPALEEAVEEAGQQAVGPAGAGPEAGACDMNRPEESEVGHADL